MLGHHPTCELGSNRWGRQFPVPAEGWSTVFRVAVGLRAKGLGGVGGFALGGCVAKLGAEAADICFVLTAEILNIPRP